jgi:hypothetical protein
MTSPLSQFCRERRHVEMFSPFAHGVSFVRT